MPTIFQRGTCNPMAGATATKRGMAGAVPAPGPGQQAMFFRGDGTWSPAPTGEVAITSDDLALPFDPVTAFENAIG